MFCFYYMRLNYIYTARHTMIGRLIPHWDTANHWETQDQPFRLHPHQCRLYSNAAITVHKNGKHYESSKEPCHISCKLCSHRQLHRHNWRLCPHSQSVNKCDPLIKCFTVTTSRSGDLLMSLATSTTILGCLMNVGPHISESLSSAHSLEELHKYGHCSAVETLAGLSGQPAAWLNIIIVMQQWVFYSDKEMRV